MSPTHAEDFIKQGLHLRGWSTRTVRTYRQGLATLPATLTKASLAAWVVEMRPRGVSAAGVNMYARTINSYLTWLHEEGHTPERLRIKLLPNPPKPLKTFSDADIRKLLTFKPEANFNSAHGRSSSPCSIPASGLMKPWGWSGSGWIWMV